MADTLNYFKTELPKRLADNPAILAGLGTIFQFDIAGAGSWSISSSGITEGADDQAGCVISTDKDTFDAILDDSNLMMQFFMEGKLSASDVGLAVSELMPISEHLF